MKYINKVGKMVKQHTIRTIGRTALIVLAATLVLIGCPDSAGDNNGNGSDTTAPEAVTNVTATPLPSGTGVLLRWTNSSSDDVTTITISWSSTVAGIMGGNATAEVGTQQSTIDNLAYATPYTFVITVTDAAGNSSATTAAPAPVNTLSDLIDADGDTLIDINSLERLHNMRYNLDVGAAGDDGRYKNSTQTADDQGILCGDDAATPCTGYELTRNLDFTEEDSYDGSIDNAMRNWLPNTAADNSGTTITDAADALNPGWQPIAYGEMVDAGGSITDSGYTPFNTLFDGNHYTIRNLFVRRPGTVALLGGTGSAAIIRNIGIDSAALYGSDNNDVIGGLIGHNSGGTVSASYANSNIINGITSTSADRLGGLIGITAGGTIIASHASGSVTGGTSNNFHYLGGLVGASSSTTPTIIIASYATATVTGGANDDYIGGVIGQAFNTTTIVASYATGAVSGGAGNDNLGTGGLVGQNGTSITIAASYATGAVTGGPGTDWIGALQGVASNTASRITASYATGNADGGGDADLAGRIVAVPNPVPANTVSVSYGFGSVTNAETVNTAGAPPMVGMPPMPITAARLTLANAGTQWNDADHLTLNAWDFGTDTQPPALKYADYDGDDGTDYGCGTTTGTIATIPSVVPDGNGGTIAVECGTTLLPGQR